MAARFIWGKIQQLNPKHKEPNLDKWADTVRLMRERDKRAHKEICELFAWANNDEFWGANILSPATLRKQWDKLTIKKTKFSTGTKSASSTKLPYNDAELESWARSHDMPPPRPGEGFPQYRGRLRSEIEKRST